MNKSINRDLFWNTAGSLIYALSSMILAFFVMRVAGASDGGIFGFGFSTFGQQMFIVAYFGIRPFQITDVSNEYSFGEYRRARILSSLVAVFISAIFLSVLFFSGEYSAYKSMVIMLLALSKTADGFADVYESECQRAGKLYLGGKALFLRTIFVMAVFMAALWLTESLLTSAVNHGFFLPSADAYTVSFRYPAKSSGRYTVICFRHPPTRSLSLNLSSALTRS